MEPLKYFKKWIVIYEGSSLKSIMALLLESLLTDVINMLNIALIFIDDKKHLLKF